MSLGSELLIFDAYFTALIYINNVLMVKRLIQTTLINGLKETLITVPSGIAMGVRPAHG